MTEEALIYAARAARIALSEGKGVTLVGAYSALEPWPDTRSSLERWKRAGLELAPLSNYTPSMLEALVTNAGLSDLFDELISTHPARAFKPSPAAYSLGPSTPATSRPSRLRCLRRLGRGWRQMVRIPDAWVNRLGVPAEAPSPAPDATGPTLAELAAFVAS